MTPRSTAAFTNMQRFYWILFLIALPAVGCDSLNKGPVVPAIVDGDSMAPTVCGAHLQTSCDECGHDFKTEFNAQADSGLTCPNCGYSELKAGDAKIVESPTVNLEPFAKFPRRWEVVGFKLPKEAEQETGVKRIVGLPGETIEIRDGDLFSRERILRKPWAMQRQVCIPVFDSSCDAIAPFDNAQRLRPESDESGWEVRGKELRFAAESESTAWLDYVNWRNCHRVGNRNQEFPIEDSYGFNQQLVRELNTMDDLIVQLDVDFENESEIQIAFRRKKSEFILSVARTETEFTISWSGASKRKPLVLVSKLKSDLPAAKIEFSSFDRAIQLRVNATKVFVLREDETAADVGTRDVFAADSMSVFRLGGKKGVFRINRLQIWRDLFYLPSPAGFEDPQNLKLTAGDDEYILLGDNSPKSLDSRSWKKPGIPASDLIGRLVPDTTDD